MDTKIVERYIDKDICERAIAEIQANLHLIDWTKPLLQFAYSVNHRSDTQNMCPNAHKEIFSKLNQFIDENYGAVDVSRSVVMCYEAGTDNLCKEHQDPAKFSIVLNLNDDFVGGGTHITKLNQTFCPPVGSLVCFPSNEPHYGVPISSGTRYVVTIWINERPYDITLL